MNTGSQKSIFDIIRAMKHTYQMWIFMRYKLLPMEYQYLNISIYDDLELSDDITSELKEILRVDDIRHRIAKRINRLPLPRGHIVLESVSLQKGIKPMNQTWDVVQACIDAGFLAVPDKLKDDKDPNDFLIITGEGKKFAHSFFWYLPKQFFKDLDIVMKWYIPVVTFILGIAVKEILGLFFK